MKTTLFFLFLIALSFTGAKSVAANDAPAGKCAKGDCEHPPRPVCFNVYCSFQRSGPAGTGFESCEAMSTFVQLVSDSGLEVASNSGPTDNPAFNIKCDEKIIYDSSAHRYTDYLGTRIQGIPGPFPAIVLPRGALIEERHSTEAALEIHDQRLDGSCYIYTGPQ